MSKVITIEWNMNQVILQSQREDNRNDNGKSQAKISDYSQSIYCS